MAIVKNTNTNYVINTPRGVSSNITFNSDAVIIPGNLLVLGATTSITTTDTAIRDNTIVLNSGESGAGVTAGSAGIVVARGSLANVSLRWTEEHGGKWQITSDGTNYANIISSNVSATYLTSVFDDKNPVLGNVLDTGNFSITSTSGNVTINANIGILYSPTLNAAAPAAGLTALYAQAPGAGSSGLYTIDSRNQNDELITKRKAIGFSLLL